MRTQAAAARLFALFVIGLPALAGNLRDVTSFPPSWPHTAPWDLNRELLLAGESQRIVFLVEVVRGFQPKIETLDHLVMIASNYSEREASWVWLDSETAPDIRWVASARPTVSLTITRRLRGEDPKRVKNFDVPQDLLEIAEFFDQVPSCSGNSLQLDTSYVFVRYLGSWNGGYGAAASFQPSEQCADREFPVIYVAQNRIAEHRVPGFSPEFLEKRALVHEYGHVLGLASNPEHGWWMDLVGYQGGAHCVDRRCAVAVPSRKAMFKGWMNDYCDACRQDIEQAREHWKSGRQFAESKRLPQPDPAASVARLKKYNFTDGGEAERLVDWGKAVVPALMERLRGLPGDRPGSPRFVASRLIREILIAEDRIRLEENAERVYFEPADDYGDALLEWWNKQESVFMEGDDWILPDGVLVRRNERSRPAP